MEAVGCPSGTSICIRDLFCNTPARLKFLKSDRSEASACVQAGLRCALGRPDVSVRFLRDGKEEFFTPGDGRPDACVYALLGRDLASAFLPLCSSDGDVRLSGFVSSPAAGRGNRSAQFFYCNGRFIRSALLQSALEQAYKNTLLTGRYPACVIWLEIRPGSVDVNVHPAKTEVKFSEERRLYGLLCQAVRDTLAEEDRTAASVRPAGDAPRRAEELPAE
jgi:DNA mismatch repair protein MutL